MPTPGAVAAKALSLPASGIGAATAKRWFWRLKSLSKRSYQDYRDLFSRANRYLRPRKAPNMLDESRIATGSALFKTWAEVGPALLLDILAQALGDDGPPDVCSWRCLEKANIGVACMHVKRVSGVCGVCC